MKTLCILHIVFLVASQSSGQVTESINLNKPSQLTPTNTISFALPASKVTQLHQTKGEKLALQVRVMVVNGDTIETERVRTRGNASSYLRRKSLNIKLKENASFYSRRDTFSLKKFYAISMNMDRNYIRNKISCDILKYLNINIPSNCYANLLINNKTEGIFMIFDPPEQFATDQCDASLVLRRGHNGTVENFQHEEISRTEASMLKQKFQSVYKEILHKYNGEELYRHLERVIDLDGYFTWLAFNHLFKNGDYADEIYLMWNKNKNRFEIVPWDFDDILSSKPHEGLEKRNAILRDKLIFSSEDALDVKIANDDFLYTKYLQCYRLFLEKLTSSALSGILNEIFQEVYPYYLHPDVIAQSQYDQSGLTDIANLKTDMRNIEQAINAQIVTHRAQIVSLLQDY